MSCFLVGDGGGTKTDILLFDEKGHVLARGRSGAANANFVDAHVATQHVADAIQVALAEANLRLDQVERMALFIPAFRRCLPLLVAKLGREEIELHGDKENALYTAFGKRQGIAVLSGTGSFAIGRDQSGNECSVGGWGPLFGDEGSAWHIGVLALRHLAATYDRAGNCTTSSRLESLILRATGATDLPDLRRAAYEPDFTRDRVAALAPLVAAAAESGEGAAQEILRTAARALAEQARTVANRLRIEAPSVALIGGVTRIGANFPELFAQAIATVAPALNCRKPLFEPIVGSALFLLDDHFSLTSDDLRSAGNELMKMGSR